MNKFSIFICLNLRKDIGIQRAIIAASSSSSLCATAAAGYGLAAICAG